ncbi:MOSC domain-containing protein [Spirosoma sp. BT702]|uniref:MOSC domain-containing protein n=1 Tax=Spirosoma profusum TaxID=2771354 RepID=A0A926XVX6_9BACT|nr:MOSC N-terminal beta barrel domain-containing protein [Spirosoma profusum]MBD2701409.1 MOSC domain-containing protein [Spirosoma profusum]
MTISELHIYPIKSLGGLSVTNVVVEAKGFRHDRRFMIVSIEGECMTQRTNHVMALIDVAIEGDVLRVWHRHHPDNVLTLPLEPPVDTLSGEREIMPVNIWDSKDVPALTVGAEVDSWFSTILGKPCRLVYMPDTTYRAVDPNYALADDAVSFADGYPYLLIGQASLDYLNQKLPQPLAMKRFRPNIVVNDSLPYEEDGWQHFRVGSLDFYGVKPCARCVLTTIDPETAQLGKEPLRTLKTYRQWKTKILFGQNVLAQSTGASILGSLRVGQPIEVVSRQEPWLAPPVMI